MDLAALIESLADDLGDHDLPIEAVDLPRIVQRCRPLALKRALRNLLENAVRYGKQARIGLELVGDQVRITIDDDGPGIPEADLERVFEPFVRLEQSRSRDTGGTGLGLAIARSIVRGHGGDITLHNRAEGGLRAVISLPHTGGR